MNGTKLEGRLDRIGKTPLEHFQDIKEVEVADGTVATVKDMLPYKCKQVEKSLKALEIIKKTKNIKVSFYENGSGKHYKIEFDKTRNQTITQEEYETIKEVLE